MQAGIVTGIALLGLAGVYQKIEVELGGKIFNNIGAEVGNYLAGLIETEIDRVVFTPLWQKIEAGLRAYTGRIEDIISLEFSVESLGRGGTGELVRFIRQREAAGGVRRI